MTFRLVTSAECEVKDSHAQECLKVDLECPEVASEQVRNIFQFFDLLLFLFIILARNTDYKSVLQKTLKQFGLVASKYERKSTNNSNFQCKRVCLCSVICHAIRFSKVRFSLAFYRRNPVAKVKSWMNFPNLSCFVCIFVSSTLTQRSKSFFF